MLVLVVVIVCFTFIHFFEYSAMLSRVACGQETRSIAIAVQNGVFVLTRFFNLLMMPVLGFVVDKGVSAGSYLVMVHFCLFGAAMAYGLVLLRLPRFLRFYEAVINGVQRGQGLFSAFAGSFSAPGAGRNFDIMRVRFNWRIVGLAAVIYGIYSLSVLLSFFAALLFHDYRATISQLSGVTNGFATILLSFVVEPMISREMDSNIESAEAVLLSSLLGRFLGVGIASQALVACLWFLL